MKSGGFREEMSGKDLVRNRSGSWCKIHPRKLSGTRYVVYSSVAHINVAPDAITGLIIPFPIVPDSSSQTNSPATGGRGNVSRSAFPVRKIVLLSQRVLRRVMAAKESLFKFGTFVPKNDREAESSPEAARWRWRAGRTLEWVRLCKEGTFDGDWTWSKVQEAYPAYKKV